jgi:hypothetical protein
MLRLPYQGTKIEANSRNSVPNHSVEEKTTLWNKNRNKLLEFFPIISAEENMLSVLFAGTENVCFVSLSQNVAAENKKKVLEQTTFEVWKNNFVKLFLLFCKTNFFRNSVPFRSRELTLPWTSECLGMNIFFHVITKPF